MAKMQYFATTVSLSIRPAGTITSGTRSTSSARTAIVQIQVVLVPQGYQYQWYLWSTFTSGTSGPLLPVPSSEVLNTTVAGSSWQPVQVTPVELHNTDVVQVIKVMQ